MSAKAKKKTAPHDLRKRPAPIAGEAVIWPAGVERRYGVTPVTRWRWERDGTLPARDIHVGGRSGWRPETLKAFELDSKNGTTRQGHAGTLLM